MSTARSKLSCYQEQVLIRVALNPRQHAEELEARCATLGILVEAGLITYSVHGYTVTDEGSHLVWSSSEPEFEAAPVQVAGTPLNFDDCLDAPDGCSGNVEYREALTVTGKRVPRCDKHWHERLQLEDAGWSR